MNVYILTYPSGGCGNFINYFINRHQSFPNPSYIGTAEFGDRKSLANDNGIHFEDNIVLDDYIYVRDNYDNIISQLGLNDCYDSGTANKLKRTLGRVHAGLGTNSNLPQPAVYDNYYGSIRDWNSLYHYERIGYVFFKPLLMDKKKLPRNDLVWFMNQSFDSISFIPTPVHLPKFFTLFPEYIVSNGDYNYKHITISIPKEFDRISSAFKNTHKFYNDQPIAFKKMEDAIAVPMFIINLGKLFDHDQTEYNKLLDFIEQPPLDNWKELITDYCSVINY
jgi:hypothetical protein